MHIQLNCGLLLRSTAPRFRDLPPHPNRTRTTSGLAMCLGYMRGSRPVFLLHQASLFNLTLNCIRQDEKQKFYSIEGFVSIMLTERGQGSSTASRPTQHYQHTPNAVKPLDAFLNQTETSRCTRNADKHMADGGHANLIGFVARATNRANTNVRFSFLPRHGVGQILANISFKLVSSRPRVCLKIMQGSA